MKSSKKASVLVLIASVLGAPTQVSGLDGSRLLSVVDREYQRTDHLRGRALGSAADDPHPWETFNQWMCFDTVVVRMEQIQIKRDNTWEPWPQLIVKAMGQNFVISPSTELQIDPTAVQGRWERLLQGSREVCFYSAFLQYLTESEHQPIESLWILNQMKTENGYWITPDFADSESIGE